MGNGPEMGTKRYHIFLGGLNSPPRHWAITEINENGLEVNGFTSWNVKINVPSWTLHLPKQNRWVIECVGVLKGEMVDKTKIHDLYEIDNE